MPVGPYQRARPPTKWTRTKWQVSELLCLCDAGEQALKPSRRRSADILERLADLIDSYLAEIADNGALFDIPLAHKRALYIQRRLRTKLKEAS